MLVGNTFYQDSSLDPGTGYPMYYWNQPNTGLVYVRNPADTAWILVGDAAQPHLGQLSTQGGNMNGAIAGAHGLANGAGHDFSAYLRQGGNDVALKNYVDQQVASLTASISTSVASALASIPSLNMSARVAKNRGSWVVSGQQTGLVIDCPKYSDGVQASESECIWGAYISYIAGGYYPDRLYYFTITETSNRVYDVTSHRGSNEASFDQNFEVHVGWFITAFRS